MSSSGRGLPVSAHSVLDVVPQLAGQSAAAAVRETVEVAQAADDLGFRRFWLAEHHGVRGAGGAAPAILAAVLAARTDRIRLGAGGALLATQRSLLIAEQFAALAAAYPSRIDLALGEGAAPPPVTAAALGWASDSRDSFPQRLDELCRFLRDGLPGRALVGDVRLTLAGLPPPVFVLAGRPASAQLAAVRGLPVFLTASEQTVAAASAYREAFQPVGPTGKPHLGVSIGVVAADTDEEALNRLAEYVRIKHRLTLASARATPAELIELLAPPITGRERGRAERLLGDPGHIVGSRSTVVSGLVELAGSTVADEIMIAPLAYDGLVRSSILRTVATALSRAVRTTPGPAPHFVATA